jgi:predicted RecA/RadA family phage recombinase
MAITGIQLRCGSDKTKSITITAPSGGVVAGAMDFIGDTIGVYYETKAVGLDVAMCISAHKILLPKIAGSGLTIAQGAKLYFTDGEAGVRGTAGGTLCGRALKAAAADDDTILAVFNGEVAA